MVRSMWLPVTSGVATVCVGLALWPSLASPADGLSLFSAAADARTPLTSLFQRLPLLGRSGAASSSSAWWSPPAEHQDLGIANVSVHRVHYERGDESSGESSSPSADNDAEETLARTLFGNAWAAAARNARFGGTSPPSTSVVVTWEDHPLAAAARPEGEAMCSAAEGACSVPPADQTPSDKETGRSVLYEVQVWVNGWGLDAFWHPANRRLTTSDPFVVVNGLPHEQEELGVRVRMKVQTRARVLAGLWIVTSEAVGPWSEVVTLSPVAEPALATLVAFMASHQFLGSVLVLLVALSTLVIGRLLVSSGPTQRRSTTTSTLPPTADRDMEMDEPRDVVGFKSVRLRRLAHHRHHYPKRRRVGSVDLEQEVADLRQELADSETEVRRLMLFRGYGIDELCETELAELERELRRTLQLVQKRRRLQHFESLDETEEEEEDGEEQGEDEDDTVVDAKRRNLRNGPLGTVFEEDAA